MKKYNFDNDTLKSIARINISEFENAGFGMFNLYTKGNERLSFRNDGGLVIQIYPYGEYKNSYVLNYYEVTKGDFDHSDLNLFEDLEDWEQDIIFEIICERLSINCSEFINPRYNMYNVLLKTISNADFDTLFNFIQSNDELKEIFDANFEKGYKWFANSDDGCFEDESSEVFKTKEECYNDMRNAALEKVKWNTEFSDYDIKTKELEKDPMDKNYNDVTIGYDIKFSPTKITHESYSGKYTYVMKRCYVDCDGKVLYGV